MIRQSSRCCARLRSFWKTLGRLVWSQVARWWRIWWLLAMIWRDEDESEAGYTILCEGVASFELPRRVLRHERLVIFLYRRDAWGHHGYLMRTRLIVFLFWNTRRRAMAVRFRIGSSFPCRGINIWRRFYRINGRGSTWWNGWLFQIRSKLWL